MNNEFYNIIINQLNFVGDYVTDMFKKIIIFTSSLGLNLSQIQVKIISLIILLLLFFLSFKFLNLISKPIKWFIILLIIILILSIIFSF